MAAVTMTSPCVIFKHVLVQFLLFPGKVILSGVFPPPHDHRGPRTQAIFLFFVLFVFGKEILHLEELYFLSLLECVSSFNGFVAGLFVVRTLTIMMSRRQLKANAERLSFYVRNTSQRQGQGAIKAALGVIFISSHNFISVLVTPCT